MSDKKLNFQISNIPEYNGAAVYALVDDNGKRYIGSSNHLRRRIKSHNSYMRTALRTGHSGFLNDEIEKALLNGANFKCEILAQINTDVSKHELEEIERIFLKHYGGLENTYNTIPLKHKV